MFWIFIAIVWVIAVGVGSCSSFTATRTPTGSTSSASLSSAGPADDRRSSGVFLLATVFFSFAQVNTGHVGVVRTFGRISGQINPGISLIAPWQSYDSVNVQVQKQTFPDLTAFSAETQNVLITTTINYSVAPKDARDLIARVGTDWFDRLVPNNLNQAFKDEAVKFTAVNIAPNREPIRTAVLKALRRASRRTRSASTTSTSTTSSSRSSSRPRSRPSRRPPRPPCAPRRRCSRRSSRPRAASPRPRARPTPTSRSPRVRPRPTASSTPRSPQRAAVHRDPEAQPEAPDRRPAGRHERADRPDEAALGRPERQLIPPHTWVWTRQAGSGPRWRDPSREPDPARYARARRSCSKIRSSS